MGADLDLKIPPALTNVLTGAATLRLAYLAGGCVRDALLGQTPKDFDIEVFGVTYDGLVADLQKFGKVDLVGRSFGVVKLWLEGKEYDFTLARRDSKTAPGHKGFEIKFDAGLSIEEATARRDFTINSMLYDPREKAVIDLHGGQRDLRQRILRHTSAAFTEDPLRVLRGFQFAARFNLAAAPETLALCRSISGTHKELAIERIWHEWLKWAAKSQTPSIGLKFLRDADWLRHYPEIAAMIGTPQDPRWHPEGDVFTHTCHCADALASLEEWRRLEDTDRAALMFAILTHDFGKAVTTVRDGDAIISPGHEKESGRLGEDFLARIGAPSYIRERVVPLAVNHMFYTEAVTDRSVRRLARRLAPETIESLAIVMTADAYGRPPKPREAPPLVADLKAKAAELKIQDSAPKPILLGRHLLERGMAPSPEFKRILDQAYEAQLDGAFADLDGALKWLDQIQPRSL